MSRWSTLGSFRTGPSSDRRPAQGISSTLDAPAGVTQAPRSFHGPNCRSPAPGWSPRVQNRACQEWPWKPASTPIEYATTGLQGSGQAPGGGGGGGGSEPNTTTEQA